MKVKPRVKNKNNIAIHPMFTENEQMETHNNWFILKIKFLNAEDLMSWKKIKTYVKFQ